MAEAPRLAYICDLFPCLTQTFVYREVEALRRAGVPLTVFSIKRADPDFLSEESRGLIADTLYLPQQPWAAEVLLSQAIWLLRAPRRYVQTLALVARGKYQHSNTPRSWLHGLIDFARGAHLARFLKRHGGFAHLHAQFADHACTATMVASQLAGIPFSFRSHTSLNPQLIGEKVRRARFVVSISRYDRDLLTQWCGTAAAARIIVNYLGVPLHQYAPVSARPAEVGVRGGESEGGRAVGRRPSAVGVGAITANGSGAVIGTAGVSDLGRRLPAAGDQWPVADSSHGLPRPLILSVGTLCAKKGFEDLVRACRLLVECGLQFHCLIVGSGPLRSRLEALIAESGLQEHVTLSPYQPQEGVRALLYQADLFTLPCIYPMDGTIDGTPVVLMEAMAAGLPVVSTTVSGVPELMRHEQDGLLVQEKDVEALAAALARLLRDPDLAHRLGAAARQTALRRFDEEANAAELASLFREELSAVSGQRRQCATESRPLPP